MRLRELRQKCEEASRAIHSCFSRLVDGSLRLLTSPGEQPVHAISDLLARMPPQQNCDFAEMGLAVRLVAHQKLGVGR